jgi:hypothetical protein
MLSSPMVLSSARRSLSSVQDAGASTPTWCACPPELVDGCGCDSGCPSCVGPTSGRLDARAATRRLLVLAAAAG